MRFTPLLLFTVGIFLMLFAVENDPFFWDTVQLASKHAHHFYEHQLKWVLLPESIDSGHPPFFGWYIAASWTVFGKTLPVSHWAMLPFLLGFLLLLFQIGRQIHVKWGWLLIPLVFFDPVVAGQTVMVSPDIVLASGFLAAVWGIQRRQNWLLALGVLLLCMISMRGMMTAAALMLWVYLRAETPFSYFRFISFVKSPTLWSFFPGCLLGLGYLCWHFLQSGWIGYHPGSPWAPAFEPVTMMGFLKNMAVLGWRFLDLGRFFEWFVIIYLLWILYLSKRIFQKKTTAPRDSINPSLAERLRDLFLLLFCLGIFLLPSALLYRNLSAHRYFIPVFICIHLIVFLFITNSNISYYIKSVLLGLTIVLMATGNLWIYPNGVSMDWDCTLSHRYYHALRPKAMQYLDNQGVDFETVGSAFPNLNNGEHLYLNGDFRRFAEKDFEHNQWMFVSNIFNDFQPEDFVKLQTGWILQKRFEQNGVWIDLYQRQP